MAPSGGGGGENEEALLASCYRACFTLAGAHGIGSIAFPAISTGVYGFPPQRAARIAASETKAYFEAGGGMKHILFVAFGDAAWRTISEVFAKI